MNRTVIRICCSLILLFSAGGVRAEELVIHAVGDIMLAGRWAPQIRAAGYDRTFDGVRTELARGDINLGNLESPIAACGTECTSKRFRFRAEAAVAEAVRKGGINLVTLANNHSMDFGAEALAETAQHLSAAGISWVGAGQNMDEARLMALYTIKGKKVAFLGYSLTQPVEFFAGPKRPGTAPGFEKLFVADVASARKQADYVIVSFHWGTEGSGTVKAYQRAAAQRAIDAGADVIIGHHPHVLQGVERYKKGIIFYSLGNFIFASKSRTADSSVIVRLRLGDTGRSAEILPLDVLNSRVGFQPRLLTGVRGREVVERLQQLSRPFKTEFTVQEQRSFISF